MALIDNLVSYWKLEEASGTRNDSHGTNHLTDNNTVLSAAGKIGTAADFETSTTEWLSITDNASLSAGDTDFTITGWVNAESLPATAVITSKGWMGADVNREYVFYMVPATNTLNFGVAAGTAASVIATVNVGTISLATWYFVAGWHDSVNNLVGCAINAGTAVTAATSAGVNDGNRDFVIGASILQAFYWDGLIDEVGWWRRVLTAPERTQLYNGGAGLAYPFSTGILRQMMEHH